MLAGCAPNPAAGRKVNVALSPEYLKCAVIMQHVSVASMSQKVFQLSKSSFSITLCSRITKVEMSH